MNSQLLLYIYLGIGLFFVLYFLFFRSKPRPPTRLNLRSKPSAPEQKPEAEQARDAKVAEIVEQVLTTPMVTAVPPEKEDRIFFVYNGHEWECHEVLGLPLGSSLHLATEKYQQLIKTSDQSTFPFYEAAFDAILKRKAEK